MSWPTTSASQPAIARNGPNAIWVSLPARWRIHDHDAEHGADTRGEHDDGQQHLPAQPRTERGEQLEVAVTHAFLAGEQLEQPVHAPQAEIARDRADDAVARADGRSALAPTPDARG